MITSKLTRTELHRVTPSEKCSDNVHIDSHRVTPSYTDPHRVKNVMIKSHVASHRVTPSGK